MLLDFPTKKAKQNRTLLRYNEVEKLGEEKGDHVTQLQMDLYRLIVANTLMNKDSRF